MEITRWNFLRENPIGFGSDVGKSRTVEQPSYPRGCLFNMQGYFGNSTTVVGAGGLDGLRLVNFLTSVGGAPKNIWN